VLAPSHSPPDRSSPRGSPALHHFGSRRHASLDNHGSASSADVGAGAPIRRAPAGIGAGAEAGMARPLARPLASAADPQQAAAASPGRSIISSHSGGAAAGVASRALPRLGGAGTALHASPSAVAPAAQASTEAGNLQAGRGGPRASDPLPDKPVASDAWARTGDSSGLGTHHANTRTGSASAPLRSARDEHAGTLASDDEDETGHSNQWAGALEETDQLDESD
jgi:hypothetical protein